MALALTSLGKVRGRRIKTRQNKAAFSFRSLPYALPPVGERRFALPEPIEPWAGILNCHGREAPACLQCNLLSPDSKYLLGQEDCLYLNVFTPHLPGAGRRGLFPVIVFFHGGAFCVSSGDSRLYGGEFLLDYGVVLVTVNYRLGPLGFFNLETDEAPGNLGMHDQVMALHWVQQHIGSFGGDQTNVTIMGESAGGMSALLHLVSPLSRGLFQKVIAMSAAASTPFLHNDRTPSTYSRALAKELGADIEGPDHLIMEHMRNLPAKAIVEKTALFKDFDFVNPMPWKPQVDGYSSRPFLPRSFEDAVTSGNFAQWVPVLTGVNSEEGLIYTAPFHKSPKRWAILFQQWEKWAPQLFFNRETELITETDKMISRQILDYFFSPSIKNASGVATTYIPEYNEPNLRTLEQIFSTAVFHAPFFRDVDLLSRAGATVYPYFFSFKGSMTLVDIFRLPIMKMMINFSGRHMGTRLYQKDLGVCHGDDLLYLFPFRISGFPSSIVTPGDRLTSQMMLSLWTNMAKFGNPTPNNRPDIASEFAVAWEPASRKRDELKEERIPYLRIGSGLAMECSPEVWGRVEFWNEVASEANECFRKTDRPVTVLYSAIAEKRLTPDENVIKE